MSKFLRGKLLIASPYLPDENFLRTVVYIVRHDVEGAFGLVLTRPLDVRLQEVFEQTLGNKPLRDDPVYLGGPVEGPLCALHNEGNYSDLSCVDGLFLTSEQESLGAIANRPEIVARFFAGYSGWGPDQLETEMGQGGWLVCDATRDDIFGDSDEVWERLVKRVGQSVMMTAVPDSQLGVDPGLN